MQTPNCLFQDEYNTDDAIKSPFTTKVAYYNTAVVCIRILCVCYLKVLILICLLKVKVNNISVIHKEEMGKLEGAFNLKTIFSLLCF